MKRQENSFKCISKDYTLDKLDIRWIGNVCTIRAVFSGKWRIYAEVPDPVYEKYRILFYISPAKAKNYLLDQLCFDGYPFSRESFSFVNIREPLNETSTNGLEMQFNSI
ncbi:MAG: hypothetical protein LKI39_01010 [Bacteroides sp.]|jgi:hypothetical protein|nr:hypothetical protein [Bacteroides sp.]MCI1681118.1 hypothetical protein [Bacteroides sp.]